MLQQNRLSLLVLLMLWITGPLPCHGDLPEVLERGALRHLGVPHARFVTEGGDGFDVELMQLFSRHLGVSYLYVETTWERFIQDLTGCDSPLDVEGCEGFSDTPMPILGDVVASGMTVLPQHRDRFLISAPVFPTQVWIIARKDSPVHPIKPTGALDQDIASVKLLLKGRTVLGKPGACLDPLLYGLQNCGAKTKSFPGRHQDMAPALLQGQAEMILLDVPDALIALDRWPDKLKVIGPISSHQTMSYAFAGHSRGLLGAFNAFLEECRSDGTLYRLAYKYYPSALQYFPDFPWFSRT